jgi:hypothetical protein
MIKVKIDGALIVAPKGVYQNWFDIEIPTYLPKHIEKRCSIMESILINQRWKNCI